MSGLLVYETTLLVISASGFIGRRLIAALATTSWAQPVAASRNVHRVEFVAGVKKLALDTTDQSSLLNRAAHRGTLPEHIPY